MMRLIFIDPQSYHGLAKYDVAYLRGLINSGFRGEISFLCSELLDQPVAPGVEVRRWFHYNRVNWLPLKFISYLLSMLRIFASGVWRAGGIYHFQWIKFPPVDLLVILGLRHLAGARVVLTAHNVVPHNAKGGGHRVLGWAYRAVDRIVVHHSDTASEISQCFSVDDGKFRTLRHGLIDLESKGKPRHEQRLRRFAAGHDTCFVFFGRGSRYKGLDLLLDAWVRAIASAETSAGLIVIGAIDPDLKDAAAKAAESAQGSLLVIDEHVTEADLYKAVTFSDAVIVPHRKISQSGALLSVLGLKIPVVVAPLAGLTEPLESAQVGWVFDGTAEGLASRLAILIANPMMLSEVKNDEQAWRIVKDAYDWNAIAVEGCRVYESLSSDSAPR
jgi:glycosyltransferase involved in cell wall biosynthesis